MINKVFADHFAADWIDSWNKRDLARILGHCAENLELSSPVLNKVAVEPSDRLIGKKTVTAYWTRALQLFPNLHFELVNTLVAPDSITLYYKSTRGICAEVFHFNENCKVDKTYAHYLTH